MAAEIYIISGFLGAGKTTLIQRLLPQALAGGKVALIENDFGDVSVDAALLKAGGLEVTELSAGCICCSLSGNFVTALKELLERFSPDIILIEPSGVGKLSDVVRACCAPEILPLAAVKAKITVVDVQRCALYLENFGEFFEDQIENADTVVLSRAEASPEKARATEKMVQELNHHARILSLPWEQLNLSTLSGARAAAACRCGHNHGTGCSCDHDHEAGCHSKAEDAFDTVTLRMNRVFSAEQLRAGLERMQQEAGGVLRAKGIVRGPGGYLQVQYVPGDIQITPCDRAGDMLCVIGHHLNRRQLMGCLDGA